MGPASIHPDIFLQLDWILLQVARGGNLQCQMLPNLTPIALFGELPGACNPIPRFPRTNERVVMAVLSSTSSRPRGSFA